MSCNDFTIGPPVAPPHPNNKVYLGDSVETPITNPGATAISVGLKLFAKRPAFGVEDYVGGRPASVPGGATSYAVNVIWTNQVRYLDETPFTFVSRVKCSNLVERVSESPTVYIVELG